MKSPILGSSYVARSVNAADSRMVNLFPEVIPQHGKEPAFLTRAPGLSPFQSMPVAAPIRGMLNLYGVVYVVCGQRLYSMTAPTFAPVLLNAGIANVITGGFTNSVSIADNGTQIMIVTDVGDGFIYNINTTVFTPMIAGIYPNFPGATTVAFIDGFFLVNKPNTQRVYASSLYDGTTWDALSFASAEKFSDNVVAVAALHGELWVFGTNSTEVWYNAGNAGFPFLPISGAFSEIGCASAYTVAKMDNTLFWLGADSRGSGLVYKSKGYMGERVSTHAVEWQIQKLPLFNANAYTYQQDGHLFYVLNTSSSVTYAPSTWVYDIATEAWHERQSYDVGTDSYLRHWGTCQCTVFDNQGILISLIGDVNYTGAIFKFDLSVYDDVGSPQRWLRSWRALSIEEAKDHNLSRTAHHSLQLDCEAGSGNAIDPQVSLRFSDDGGHTWSNPRAVGMGIAGDYSKRVIWRRLGMTMKLRDRVYEVSGTDPCKVNIMGAELHMSNTNA